jgi:hypothetical protein
MLYIFDYKILIKVYKIKKYFLYTFDNYKIIIHTVI